MVWGLRAYCFVGSSGLPCGGVAHDKYQATSMKCAAQFLIDVSRDVGRKSDGRGFVWTADACFGWMDAERDWVGDAPDARKSAGRSLQDDAIGKLSPLLPLTIKQLPRPAGDDC